MQLKLILLFINEIEHTDLIKVNKIILNSIEIYHIHFGDLNISLISMTT